MAVLLLYKGIICLIAPFFYRITSFLSKQMSRTERYRKRAKAWALHLPLVITSLLCLHTPVVSVFCCQPASDFLSRFVFLYSTHKQGRTRIYCCVILTSTELNTEWDFVGIWNIVFGFIWTMGRPASLTGDIASAGLDWSELQLEWNTIASNVVWLCKVGTNVKILHYK